ncbi:hypothetical protein NQZ68_002656 [Dissostichus eleginoides]|nr:hypothetical protein NQZ68_002656 [Dissostichus eleginoides]
MPTPFPSPPVSHVGSCISTGASDCCHGVKYPCNLNGFTHPPPPSACVYLASTLLPSQLLSTGVVNRYKIRGNKHRPASSYLMECILSEAPEPLDAYFCRLFRQTRQVNTITGASFSPVQIPSLILLTSHTPPDLYFDKSRSSRCVPGIRRQPRSY